MFVHLSHPERHIEMKGPKRVKDVLRDLNLIVEAHLVIRDNELVTEDETISDRDTIEIRPVISGGAPERRHPSRVTRPSGKRCRFPRMTNDP